MRDGARLWTVFPIQRAIECPSSHKVKLSRECFTCLSYRRLSKPINQIQTEAAKTGESLSDGRELKASWDRSLIIRVPLLVAALLAQGLVLLVVSA